MPALTIPLDGRLTSQNVLTSPLDSTSVVPIVSPGNATSGNSYQVSLATLATFFGGFSSPTIIQTGTTYPSVGTDTRILMDLTVPAAFTITILSSASYTQPILIKDIAGNLSAVDTLTTNFSSGQTADGLSTIVLSNPYAGFWLNPLASGGFYLTAA